MDPVHKGIIGGFFVVLGLVMVLFRGDLKTFYDDLFESLYAYYPLMIRGRLLAVLIPVVGVLSIIGGGLVLLIAMSDLQIAPSP